MNARSGLVLCLVLSAAACSGTAAENRDKAINTAFESARLGCLTLRNDKSIEREPGVDAWCDALLEGCPK